MFDVSGFPNVKQPVKNNNSGSGVVAKKINVSNTSFALASDGLYETTVSHNLGVELVNVVVTDTIGDLLSYEWKPSGLNQVKIAIVEKIDVKVTVTG